jgi:hypothetical protein
MNQATGRKISILPIQPTWSSSQFKSILVYCNPKESAEIDCQFSENQRLTQSVSNRKWYRRGTELPFNPIDGSSTREQDHTPSSKAMLRVMIDCRSGVPIAGRAITRISMEKLIEEMKEGLCTNFNQWLSKY